MSFARRVRPRTVVSCGVSLLLSAACASAAPSPSVPAPLPASNVRALEGRMPARVGAFALSAHESIRGSETDVIYRYRDGSPANVSVILYPVDYQGSKATGAPRVRVDHEGMLFAQSLAYQKSRGSIETWRLLSQRSDSIPVDGSWIASHVTVATTVRRGESTYELQFLHVVQGDFVKVRASVPAQSWPRTDLAAFDSSLVTMLAAH